MPRPKTLCLVPNVIAYIGLSPPMCGSCALIPICCAYWTESKHKKSQTSKFTWFPKTGYVHGGSRLYINGGMIQTLNSTQYNPQKPVFHSYTLFSQIYTCIHSHSCILSSSSAHLLLAHSALSLCLHSLVPLFCLQSVYMRKESINIVAVKERVVGSG